MQQTEEIGQLTLSNKLRRVLWNIVSLFLFRPFVTNVFAGWRRCVLRLFGAKIANSANIYPSAKIWAPWNLMMEDGSCIGPNVICYNQAIVVLKENAIVSQYSYLCTAGHRTDQRNTAEAGLVVASILIDKDAWIGTRAYIGMGVTIGEGAIVGATASVYKDVEPWTIVGGNPAKFIKKRELKKNR